MFEDNLNVLLVEDLEEVEVLLVYVVLLLVSDWIDDVGFIKLCIFWDFFLE